LGRLEVGWGKVVCWRTKATISESIKIEEIRRAYRNSPTLLRTVPSPTPCDLLFPKIGGSQPPPQNASAIISGMGEATDFKFGRCFYKVHRNKSPLKIWREGDVGIFRDCPNFSSTPCYL